VQCHHGRDSPNPGMKIMTGYTAALKGNAGMISMLSLATFHTPAKANTPWCKKEFDYLHDFWHELANAVTRSFLLLPHVRQQQFYTHSENCTRRNL
jgi:hypothetical protein